MGWILRNEAKNKILYNVSYTFMNALCGTQTFPNRNLVDSPSSPFSILIAGITPGFSQTRGYC